MEKYLFNDGLNGVKEVQSKEELENLLQTTADPARSAIWLFNTHEWISYATYRKRFPLPRRKTGDIAVASPVPVFEKPAKRNQWLKKFLVLIILPAGAFLIFNFTRVKWQKTAPLDTVAARPANVPVMDIDSLIRDIEDTRGSSLDRSTKTNLRLRNTWPDRIELKLHAERETGGGDSRFSHISISVDNTTGFAIDHAVARLVIWKNNKISASDTVHFNDIQYNRLLKKSLDATYRGDSLSVSFESIRAKAFNFCYAADVKNNSGNYNDRWFCRDNNQ